MERRETLPIPRGWFAVAHSDEIAKGEVQKAHYFGQDLVVFRTESGKAGVFDAYCPHLGAHLGVGGKVEGETQISVCPDSTGSECRRVGRAT